MKETARLFAHYFSKQKKSLITNSCLGVIHGLLLIPVPLLLRYLIDQSEHGDWKQLSAILSLLLLISILSMWLMTVSRLGIVKSVKHTIQELRGQLATKVIEIPHRSQWSEYKDQLKDIIVDDTERLDLATTIGFGQILPALISTLLLTIMLLVLSPALFIIVFCIFPVCTIVLYRARMKQTVLQEKFRDSFSAIEKKVAFIVDSWDLVKAQTAEEVEKGRQAKAFSKINYVSWLLAKQHIYLQAVQESMGVLFGVLLLAVGFYLIFLNILSLGQVIAFFAGFSLLRMQLASIFNGWPQIINFASSLGHIDRILSMKHDTPYFGTDTPRIRGEISLQGIVTTVAGKKVLDSVSAVFEANRMTCITGRNGEGKTTLLLTMLGLIAPDAGEVYVDGTSLKAIDIRKFREQLAVVFQHPFFMDDTVEENIHYGLPIQDSEPVMDLPEFMLANDRLTFSLSGGERQKVMIGRALKRSPKILFLDEPTNHLDSDSVERLLKHLATIRHQVTIICITHEPALIAMADAHYHLSNARLEKVV